MPINQKHYLPRIAGGKNFSFSRTKFLNGTIPTFFGPYQTLDAVNGYSGPTAWPAAGTLLRVPQVVYLSATFPFLNVPMAATMNVTVTYFSVNGGLPRTFTVPNHYYTELTRLQAVFASVKSAIESIRPNRTWVYVVPIFNSGLSDWIRYINGPHTNLLQVLTPASDASFFGTDFLHVNCGDLGVWDGSVYASESQPTFECMVDGFLEHVGTIPEFLASDTVQTALADLTGAYGKFRRYAAWIYPHNLDWTDWPDLTKTDPDTGRPDTAVNLEYQGLEGHVATNQEAFSAIAETFAELGVTSPGTSDEVTAESLKTAIASHFGFDPTTGADLVG